MEEERSAEEDILLLHLHQLLYTDYYFFLAALWGILLFALFLNLDGFIHILRDESRRRLLFLLLILFAGTALRIWVTPYMHHVFYDEFGHFEKALTWSTAGKEAFPTRHMPGWSFLLSLAFSIFGPHASTGFILSAFSSVLSILFVYFFIRGFLPVGDAPLWGALFTAFLPLHLRYSAGMDSALISFVFLCLALTALSFYIARRGGRQLFFLMVSSLWCVYIRQENIILLVLSLVCIIIVEFTTAWQEGKGGEELHVPFAAGMARMFRVRKRLPVVLCMTGLLLLPCLVQNFLGLQKSIYGEYFLDRGVSESMWTRASLNLVYFFRNSSHPLLFTLLALFGIVVLLREKQKRILVAGAVYWMAGYFFIYLFIEGHFK